MAGITCIPECDLRIKEGARTGGVEFRRRTEKNLRDYTLIPSLLVLQLRPSDCRALVRQLTSSCDFAASLTGIVKDSWKSGLRVSDVVGVIVVMSGSLTKGAMRSCSGNGWSTLVGCELIQARIPGRRPRKQAQLRDDGRLSAFAEAQALRPAQLHCDKACHDCLFFHELRCLRSKTDRGMRMGNAARSMSTWAPCVLVMVLHMAVSTAGFAPAPCYARVTARPRPSCGSRPGACSSGRAGVGGLRMGGRPRVAFIQTGGTIDKDYPRSTMGYAFEIADAATERVMADAAHVPLGIDYEFQTACRKVACAPCWDNAQRSRAVPGFHASR
jgi:hypothetical protein